MTPVDKILGADVELGNVVEHAGSGSISNDYAARLLLAEIDGVPSISPLRNGDVVADPVGMHSSYGDYYAERVAGTYPGADPQDWGRKFLVTTGGCAYIDLGHCEICLPEVRSATDFVRYHNAGLALVRAARDAASGKLPQGQRIVVMANNSDRHGSSWGGHLNVLITRDLWERIFDRMYPDLFVLAAFQVSSILYTGQGKVGSENGTAWVDFQLTQRGDFFECIVGEQTTYRRPLVNARDEAHCGTRGVGNELARLHVIFHDTTLTDTSNFLKAGVTQLVLALMETGWCDRQVMLENPLEALRVWNRDPQLEALATLADGRRISAIEHQRLFLGAVKEFVDAGDAECVPEATRIVALWEDTLERLELRDTAVLTRRLDWALKRELLSRAIEREPALRWNSPSIRAADLRFASLGTDGLYQAVAAAGGVDTIVSAQDAERAAQAPPEDTRAWTRTMLLRSAARADIERVNWDEVRVHRPRDEAQVFRFDDPRRHGRADVERAMTVARGDVHFPSVHTAPSFQTYDRR